MFFLTFNCGSSSIKMECFYVEETSIQSLIFIEVDAIGLEHQSLQVQARVQEKSWQNKAQALQKLPLKKDFKSILEAIIRHLKDWELPFQTVHRMVHHGTLSKRISQVQNIVELFELEKLIPFAPLHHPANLEALTICMKELAQQKPWIVFDTLFHASMPPRATRYAIPSSWEDLGIFRYGFHGSSYAFLTEEMQKQGIHDFIACHMGNGISLCAIENSKSIETSMGFSPMEGPLMGTRSGSIDDGIIFYLLKKGFSAEEIEKKLLKESGLLALSKLSSDVRILRKERKNKPEADFALTYLCYHMSRNIASLLPCFRLKPQAIVFTGGIGANAEDLRAEIMAPLAFLGLPVHAMLSQENLQMVREVLKRC